jgi:hypothetical protein
MGLNPLELRNAGGADLRPRPRGWLSERLSALRRAIRRAGKGGSNEIAARIDRMSAHVERSEWQEARAEALAIGAVAEDLNDPGLMKKAGRALLRLGGGARAWELLAQSKLDETKPEWDGSDLREKSLLVERREGDLAVFLQFAPLLAAASARARRCVVLTEPRMVPLYRRSFPALDVRVEGPDSEPVRTEADVLASFETLAFHFWKDDKQQQSGFVPIKADAGLAADFRAHYLGRAKSPLIGISWGSLNKSKRLPSLADWGNMLAAIPGTFVSLQYGDIRPALGELEEMVPGRILHDPTVDQLADMDRFAAQVAALDAVVTISNTGAHLCGAMGVPTVVILGDKFHLMWPVVGGPAPYPKTILVRESDRPWPAVMEEARASLSALMASDAG